MFAASRSTRNCRSCTSNPVRTRTTVRWGYYDTLPLSFDSFTYILVCNLTAETLLSFNSNFKINTLSAFFISKNFKWNFFWYKWCTMYKKFVSDYYLSHLILQWAWSTSSAFILIMACVFLVMRDSRQTSQKRGTLVFF